MRSDTTQPTTSRLDEKLLAHFDEMMNHLPALPPGVAWLLPLRDEPECRRVFEAFLRKYYHDDKPRHLVLGINPGRFGAGLTNVAFTDPAHLLRCCGIDSAFPKREELSARFIYRVVEAWGGPASFYKHFFVNSVVPFGFVKGGKNYNYYDSRQLERAVTPLACRHINGLIEAGMCADLCFCLGEGKNFQYLQRLNEQEGFFEKIIPLSHPRYIMQYRRKFLDQHLSDYLEALGEVRNSHCGRS
ncbi:MAG: hypothetical protein KatS3mg030_104 [Saprospiraceae bacterium]|nr:MAG: hypothetical protein KatS3mg030_104 [Saprospiraceae bacterium]